MIHDQRPKPGQPQEGAGRPFRVVAVLYGPLAMPSLFAVDANQGAPGVDRPAVLPCQAESRQCASCQGWRHWIDRGRGNGYYNWLFVPHACLSTNQCLWSLRCSQGAVCVQYYYSRTLETPCPTPPAPHPSPTPIRTLVHRGLDRRQ